MVIRTIRADSMHKLTTSTTWFGWAFADGHVKAFRPSGVANDGTKQGVKFEGYEQKAGTWVNSTDPYWDQGLSCFDAEWNANNNSRDCKLPDQS